MEGEGGLKGGGGRGGGFRVCEAPFETPSSG